MSPRGPEQVVGAITKTQQLTNSAVVMVSPPLCPLLSAPNKRYTTEKTLQSGEEISIQHFLCTREYCTDLTRKTYPHSYFILRRFVKYVYVDARSTLAHKDEWGFACRVLSPLPKRQKQQGGRLCRSFTVTGLVHAQDLSPVKSKW